MDTPAVVIEALEGISSCFVYIRKEDFAQENRAIHALTAAPCKIYNEHYTTVVKTELGEMEGKGACQELAINSQVEERMRAALVTISCKCGCSTIHNESTLKLPSEGWEELVDMWSCHNREFERLLGHKLSPRPNGILYANFYLIIATDRVPKCMEPCATQDNNSILFYNTIQTPFTDEYLIFHYLYELFQVSRVVDVTSEKEYELKLLEVTKVYIGTLKPSPPFTTALKIAFSEKAPQPKPSPKPSAHDHAHAHAHAHIHAETETEPQPGPQPQPPTINPYFSKAILRILTQNSTRTFVGGDEITFVVQK
ncbi:hypothetical protein NEDG_01483 [Nematocida displodere]|uniref:Uncharacterized protein n=1 Tax=Nematocida displodere TaxID=1805483 RepID=A0A177EDZ5_9MICR|nr:hypothetical protein NEDG_01483 [Nematocida displodere]